MKAARLLIILVFLAGCSHIRPPLRFENQETVDLKRIRLDELRKRSAQKPVVIPGSIAVKTFLERGIETGLGLAATEFFTANLSLFEQLTLIDRSYTEILEMEMSAFNPERQRQILSAEQFLTGYTELAGDAFNINLFAMPPKQNSFQLLSALKGKESDFFRLVADLNIAFLEKTGITVSREMANRMYRVPTESIQAYILYSRGRRAEYTGNYQEAAEYYRRAQRMDSNFKEPETGLKRVDQAIKMASAAPHPTSPAEFFESPPERQPDFTEKNVPPVGNKGLVIININLFNQGLN